MQKPAFHGAHRSDSSNQIHCAPFWYDFAWLVGEGVKLLDTRGRPWPYPPGWLAIYATKGRGNAKQRPILPEGIVIPNDAPKQALTSVVWIAGSRPLLRSDTQAACYYADDLWAWEITKIRRFVKPVPLAETGLMSWPQSVVYLKREVVVRALGEDL